LCVESSPLLLDPSESVAPDISLPPLPLMVSVSPVSVSGQSSMQASSTLIPAVVNSDTSTHPEGSISTSGQSTAQRQNPSPSFSLQNALESSASAHSVVGSLPLVLSSAPQPKLAHAHNDELNPRRLTTFDRLL